MALTQINDRGLETPIDLLDNEKIRLGTGNDLEIYHNGSHSYISSATGNFNVGANTSINLLGGTDFAEYMARFIDDGAVELYNDGDKKLETTSSGVTVTGTLEATTYVAVPDQIYHVGDADTTIRFPAADTIALETAGSERLRIDSNGDVGIGTSNPTTPLHVKGVSGTLNVDSDPQLVLETSATDGAANKGTGILFLNHDGSGGSFGGSIQCLKENGTSGNTAHFMRLSTRHHNGAVTERMRIDSSGKLGIGTTGPTGSLHVKSDVTTNAYFETTSGSGAYLQLALGASGAGLGYLGHSNQLCGSPTAGNLALRFEGTALEFAKGSAIKARITNDGLCFGADTAAANALDDYEEGTFTPNWVGTNSAGSTSYNANDGSYTKIGNLVHIRIYSNISSTTGTGSWQCNNLPFTGASGNDNITTGSCMTDGFNIPTNYSWIVPYKNSGTTNLDLFASGDDVGWNHLAISNDSNFSIILGITYCAA